MNKFRKLKTTRLALKLASRPKVLSEVSSQHRAKINRLTAESRELIDPGWDFESVSLQTRLLDYFQSKGWIVDHRKLLHAAEASRKKVAMKVRKEALLGLHGRAAEAQDWANVFTELELLEIYSSFRAYGAEAITEENVQRILVKDRPRSEKAKAARYINWLLEKCAASPLGKLTEVFNPLLAVFARLWTYPHLPLWLLPSAVGAPICSALLGIEVNEKDFNSHAKQNGLLRLDFRVLRKFATACITDAEAQHLEMSLQHAVGDAVGVPGFRLAHIRPISKSQKSTSGNSELRQNKTT